MTVVDNAKLGEDVRVDYLKFLVVLPVEEVIKWKRVWYALFDDDHIASGGPHHATVGSVKRAENGDYMYAFEAWGDVCANVVDLPFDQWAPYLHRVDIRRAVDVTQPGLDVLYSWLRENCGDNRNIQQFNTKPRSKRGGRNAGGIGLQVGSHKSDFRIVVYKRHGEVGAVEVNLAGDVLNDIKSTAMSMRKSNSQPWQDMPWRCLLLACDARGQRKAELASGIPYFGIIDMSTGKNIPEPTTEELLANVDAILDRLPLDGQHAVLETLQRRLFPYE
jgi:hypothetical protein